MKYLQDSKNFNQLLSLIKTWKIKKLYIEQYYHIADEQSSEILSQFENLEVLDLVLTYQYQPNEVWKIPNPPNLKELHIQNFNFELNDKLIDLPKKLELLFISVNYNSAESGLEEFLHLISNSQPKLAKFEGVWLTSKVYTFITKNPFNKVQFNQYALNSLTNFQDLKNIVKLHPSYPKGKIEKESYVKLSIAREIKDKVEDFVKLFIELAKVYEVIAFNNEMPSEIIPNPQDKDHIKIL